jgi:uncharacterized protein YhaN
MKINGLYIDGFGIFHDTEFSSLSPKVTVVRGRNESGKTTLLAFLRRMIFGFPRKAKGVNLYEPLNGGVQGGRLLIESGEGAQYTLQRDSDKKAPRILLPDGSHANIPPSKLIGSADQSFFENVFAFGLDELQNFETLSAESIQSHLMSAGAGMTKIPIPNVQQDLATKIRNLYFKGEKGAPTISKKIKEVKELESDLRSLLKTKAEYDRCCEEREEIERELAGIKREKARVEREIKIKENILGVKDDWDSYCQATEELERLPELESFPEKGVDRLESLNERIEALTSQCTDSDIKYQQNAREISAIVLDERVLSNDKRIQKLDREKDRYLSDRQEIQNLEWQSGTDRKDLTDLIQSVQKGWTEEDLLSFDASSSAKNRVDTFENDFKQYEREIWELHRQREELSKAISTLQSEIEVLKGRIPERVEGISNEQLKEQGKALDYLAIHVPKLEQKQIEHDHLVQREAELGTEYGQRAALTRPEIPVWPAGVIVIAGVISLLAGLLQESILPGGVIFVLLMIVALIYYRSARSGQGEAAPAPGGVQNEDILSMAHLRRNKEAEIRELENGVLEKARSCGISGIPDNATVAARRREIEEVSRSVTERDGICRQIREKETTLEASESDLLKKEAAIRTRENDLEVLTNEWRTWLASAGLDAALSPATVHGVFSTVKEARQKSNIITRSRERLAELSQRVSDFETEVANVLEVCGIVSSGSCDTDVHALAVSLETNRTTKTGLDTLQNEQRRLEVELNALNEQITQKGEERNKLFRSGFAEDEEGFRRNGATWDRKMACTAVINGAESRLKRAAGRDENYPGFIEMLNGSDFPIVAQEKDLLAEKLSEIEGTSNGLHVRLGELKTNLEHLENDDAASVKRNERESILEDIHVDSREWAKLTIAQYILGKAIERYERERQPAVYRQAQEYFAAITDGKYRRILKPIDSSEILVEDKSGRRLDARSLSRGTSEQLYLALRFGYISEFIKHDEPLPIIFDDILVNFDPERKKNSCKAISQLAESNQVLFFTCHPETVEILLEKNPDAQVIDLEGI